LVASATQWRHRSGECTRRATEATRYRCLATRAEPTRGFAEGAKSVESSEELAPEKLDAVEPHALKRLFVGAHGSHQQHVPELPVLRPARACTIAVPGENAVQVRERQLADQGSSCRSDSEREREQMRHRAGDAPTFHERLSQRLREAPLRRRTARGSGPLGGVRLPLPPCRLTELEIEQEQRARARAAPRRLVHAHPEF